MNYKQPKMNFRKELERKLQLEVDKFNTKHPVGSKVSIKKDNGGIQEVTVSYAATVLMGHTSVGYFKEITGCYELDRVIE